MRVAVISDTHGNYLALDAVLADLETHPADQIVFLGDMVQGGAQPVQVVQRLQALNYPIVMGNADAWMLNGEETGAETTTPAQAQMREWSLAQLSDDERAFIAGFRPTVDIELEGGRRLLCFHGSPHSFDDIILPTTAKEEFATLLGPFVPSIMCGGHTHMQQIRRIADTFFFNPGSAGFAYSHLQADDDNFQADPWAEYAVLTSEGDRVALEFRTVQLDAQELIDIILKSGKPNAATSAGMYGWSES